MATRTLQLETIAAIHRSIFARPERNLSLIPTASTGYTIHLALFAKTIIAATTSGAVSALCFASRTARRTTGGSIGQATARKKFLLTSSECESFIAVPAIQGLISIGHFFSHFQGL